MGRKESLWLKLWCWWPTACREQPRQVQVTLALCVSVCARGHRQQLLCLLQQPRGSKQRQERAQIEEKAQIQWEMQLPELSARAANEQETFLPVRCSARLGEKQLGCEAEGFLTRPGMESSCHEAVQLCGLVATAGPGHVCWFTCPRSLRTPPAAAPRLAQGPPRPSAPGQGRALGQRHTPARGAAGTNHHPPGSQCPERPPCPGVGGVPWHRCPLAFLSPGTRARRPRPLTCLALPTQKVMEWKWMKRPRWG